MKGFATPAKTLGHTLTVPHTADSSRESGGSKIHDPHEEDYQYRSSGETMLKKDGRKDSVVYSLQAPLVENSGDNRLAALEDRSGSD